MNYVEDKSASGRLIGFGFVALLHVALVWVLVNGLAQSAVEIVTGPIEARIIEEIPLAPADPVPPPPELAPPPKAFVPLPEVTIDLPPVAPETTAITAEAKPVEEVTPPQPPSAQADPAHANRRPDYPASSRRLGHEGTVVLLLNVDVDGRVRAAKVESSSGYPRLDEAALEEALKSWRFQPVLRAGTAVAVWQRYAVTFRLTDG